MRYDYDNLDPMIIDTFNKECILPDWTNEIPRKWEFVTTPLIDWYDRYTQEDDVNKSIYLCGRSWFLYDDEIYPSSIRKSLDDKLVVGMQISKIGLLNRAALDGITLEEQIRSTIRHEFRHILQRLIIYKYEGIHFFEKIIDIQHTYYYDSENEIFEEDARNYALGYEEDIEQFYQLFREYKKN